MFVSPGLRAAGRRRTRAEKSPPLSHAHASAPRKNKKARITRALLQKQNNDSQTTATGILPIFACHSRGPVMCADVPPESTATVTGMSTTSNS